jgi:hypothetical protein
MLTVLAILALFTAFSANAKVKKGRSSTASASYVYQLKKGGTAKGLKTSLKSYKPSQVRDLGNLAFEVTFPKDPGLKALEKHAKKASKLIELVQPNMMYQASKAKVELPPEAPAHSGF